MGIHPLLQCWSLHQQHGNPGPMLNNHAGTEKDSILPGFQTCRRFWNFDEDGLLVTYVFRYLLDCLAWDLDSHVVGADSNIGGVGVSKGSGSNSMRGISSIHDMTGDCVVSEGGVDKGPSRTLDNMLNSMVLGNVLGTKHSVGDSGVVAGVVVAGHTVGSRDSSIGGHGGHNRVNS